MPIQSPAKPPPVDPYDVSVAGAPSVWPVMGALILAEVCATVAGIMPLPALPAWLRLYGDPAAVGWIVSAFLLVAASVAALCGSLGDHFGRKPVLLIILGLTTVGCLMSAAGGSLGWIIAGRCLQGTSGAIMPLVLGMSREVLPANKVSFGFGVILTSGSVSAALGFPIAGVLTDQFGPASIFWAIGLVAISAMICVLALLPSAVPSTNTRQIDWIGGLLFAPAVALMLFSVSNSRSGAISPLLTWTLIAAGTILLAFWYRYEFRHPAPLIDVRLLADPRCAAALAITALVGAGAFQIVEVGALLLQQPAWTGVGLALTATAAGLVKMPAVLGGAAASMGTGWVAGRVGPWPCVLAGSAVAAAGAFVAIALHDSVTSVLVLILMVMMGLTAVFTAVPVLIAVGTPPSRMSEAMGVMAVVRAVCHGSGAQLVAVLLASATIQGAGGVRYPTEFSYNLAFGYMGATASLIFLAALSMFRRPSFKAAEIVFSH